MNIVFLALAAAAAILSLLLRCTFPNSSPSDISKLFNPQNIHARSCNKIIINVNINGSNLANTQAKVYPYNMTSLLDFFHAPTLMSSR
jgi:hypothetical protein